jgi:hypothetical protein
VERRHKLPTAARQAPVKVGSRTIYLDNLTEQAQCQTAADVASVLRDRGRWVGGPCRLPGCPV